MPDRDEQLQRERDALRLFEQWLELDDGERPAFLARACGDDEGLRELVERLVATSGALDQTLREVPGDADPRVATVVPPNDLPALGEQSVLFGRKLGLELGRGVRLTHLQDEPELPSIAADSERFELLRVLGTGGFGKVYLAFDRDLNRTVALKVVRADRVRMQARFLEEAQVMAQLEHPNIVPVYELGVTADGTFFYTMRVVRGRTLSALLDELREASVESPRPRSYTRLVQIFLQVAQAMSYAHAKGVLHRDLKPANLMLGEHGEVQVLDWGLSKLMRAPTARTGERETSAVQSGIAGTLYYMAPEQARGEAVDARTDIYALGVILYEMLTLSRPFEGSAEEVLSTLQTEEPRPPRRVGGGRHVPRQLEAICLRALAKRPSERFQTADEFHRVVMEWLEADAERSRRHELAEANAAEGAALLAEYRSLQKELVRQQESAAELASNIDGWQPVEDKAELIATQDRVDEIRRRIVKAAAGTVASLEKALGFEDDNLTARALLADYYWDRVEGAEARSDRDALAFNLDRVRSYDVGSYTNRIKGDGSVALCSDPAGADVWLHEYAEVGLTLVERAARHLGTTPTGPVEVPMGSYLAVLKKDGYRDTRYPIHITRNRVWSGEVTLLTDAEIGAAFQYVPGGPAVQGGDPHVLAPLPSTEPVVGSFLMATHPVTMEEYLEFLHDVTARSGLEAAKSRAPAPNRGDTYLRTSSAGRLELPGVDDEGHTWHLRFPVFGISYHAAVEYCAWRSERDRMALRLPTSVEWEKAARGVDGRWYPWGNRFDPCLCNMEQSLRRSSPAPIEDFPADCSVYGVRGMAGNMEEWTSTVVEHANTRAFQVVRGGCWYSSTGDRCRVAHQAKFGPSARHENLGLRLTRSV